MRAIDRGPLSSWLTSVPFPVWITATAACLKHIEMTESNTAPGIGRVVVSFSPMKIAVSPTCTPMFDMDTASRLMLMKMSLSSATLNLPKITPISLPITPVKDGGPVVSAFCGLAAFAVPQTSRTTARIPRIFFIDSPSRLQLSLNKNPCDTSYLSNVIQKPSVSASFLRVFSNNNQDSS